MVSAGGLNNAAVKHAYAAGVGVDDAPLSGCASLGVGSAAEGTDISSFMSGWVDLEQLASPMGSPEAAEVHAPAHHEARPHALSLSLSSIAAATATAVGLPPEPPPPSGARAPSTRLAAEPNGAASDRIGELPDLAPDAVGPELPVLEAGPGMTLLESPVGRRSSRMSARSTV